MNAEAMKEIDATLLIPCSAAMNNVDSCAAASPFFVRIAVPVDRTYDYDEERAADVST
jgi:hypothetical protein